MTKKIYLIANWKMQLTLEQAIHETQQILNWQKENDLKKVEVILCPSFIALSAVSILLKSSLISVGGQNVFYRLKGAYTGEVSVVQLKEIGVKYVIIGHSERRQFNRESDDDVNRKIKAALEAGLIPIVCIGETIDERRLGKTDVAIIHQLVRGFEDISLTAKNKIIIAYEPVWAISPAPPAEPADAFHASRIIQRILLEFFSREIVQESVSIIYGGSVDSSNVKDFIDNNLIQGALVGGASLKASEFINIITKVEE